MKSIPSVRNNIIANFSGKAWASAFSLAFVPVYIKLMGVEVYGLLGVFMSLGAILSLLDLGLSATLSRELSRLSAVEDSGRESRNLVRTFETVYWGIGILIGIVVVALAPLIAKYWINSGGIDGETVERTLMIMGMSIAIQWPGSIYSGGLMGLQRQVVLNIIRSVMVMVQHAGAVLVLVFVSPSILSFFLWQSFVGLLSTIALAVWLWKSLPQSVHQAEFDKGLLIKGWRFATGITGISLVTILLTQLDKIILSKMLTLEMFAYYMLAFNVANALHNLVTPISSALFPKFTQIVALGEKAKLAILYHQGCQLLSVLVLPAAITIAIFSKEILTLWLGDTEATQNAYQILTLLMIGTALNALMTLPYTVQLAYGWTRLIFYTNVTAVILLVPLMVWMVEMYQGIGAACAWIILNSGYYIFLVPIMHRSLLKGEMGKWYRRDIILPILITTAIGLFARTIMPVDASKLITLFGMLITLVLTFSASVLAADNLNFRMLKANRS